MTEPVPAPIFFACSREAVELMRQSGMTDMAIATALISVRAAAITEERHRVEWIAANYPPHAGIRPQDIMSEIRGDECALGWKIPSEATTKAIEEIDANRRNALINADRIIAGASTVPNGDR